jgi:hypothetical protein
VQQTLRLQTAGQGRQSQTYPNDNHKVIDNNILPLMWRHVPSGVSLTFFRHPEDNNCWWCGGTVAQTPEHLLPHCRPLIYQPEEMRKDGGKAECWKVGQWWREQVSELCSMELCEEARMDFVEAMDVRKSPPKCGKEPTVASLSFPFLFLSFIDFCTLSLSSLFVLAAGTHWTRILVHRLTCVPEGRGG